MSIRPAIADLNWLEEDQLYLAVGSKCEIDRPLFQGDVFTDIPLPILPAEPVPTGGHAIEFESSMAMLVPHPCQCYNGDNVRPYLTIAPVTAVQSYDNFGEDRTGAKDKFALLGLPVGKDAVATPTSCVANFGRLISVPRRWLSTRNRIACLSHEGIGLLGKRLLQFQMRCPTTLAQAMAFTAGEWNESFLMQAWVRKYGKLKKFTRWMRTPQIFRGVADGRPVTPYEIRELALDVLLEAITGSAVHEPGDPSEGG